MHIGKERSEIVDVIIKPTRMLCDYLKLFCAHIFLVIENRYCLKEENILHFSSTFTAPNTSLPTPDVCGFSTPNYSPVFWIPTRYP